MKSPTTFPRPCRTRQGKYLPVPYPFAHGLVVDCEDVDLDAFAMWIVNFGAQYGVQWIRETDCEVIWPPTRWTSGEGNGEAMLPVAEEWAPMGEGTTVNQVQYRWIRGRGRKRGGGRAGRGAAAARGRSVAADRGRDTALYGSGA
jgi:hypothetical protein